MIFPKLLLNCFDIIGHILFALSTWLHQSISTNDATKQEFMGYVSDITLVLTVKSSLEGLQNDRFMASKEDSSVDGDTISCNPLIIITLGHSFIIIASGRTQYLENE